MTDRESDEEDASNWLASQFDPTGEVPKQKTPDAAVPPAAPGQTLPPQAPLQPQMPPAPQAPLPPQAPLLPQAPPAPVPPAAPATPVFPPASPTAYPPAAAAPVTPPAQPSFPQQPAYPPAAPPQQPAAPTFSPPAQPVQPAQPVPPAQPVQPAQPVPPQAPAHPVPPAQSAQPPGGFSWGLSPGDSPIAGPPATPAPPAATPPAAQVPPANPIPPAAVPPAATPPPAAPPSDPFADLLSPPVPPVQPVAPAQPAAPPAAPEPPAPFYRPVASEPAPLDAAIDGTPSVEAQPPATAMPFETTVLPDVAPDAADAPPFWEPEPTQMMDALDLEPDPPARVPQPVPTSVFPPQTRSTEAFGFGDATTDGPSETEQVSAIDALFGDTQFREYTDGLDASQNPFVRKAEADSGRGPIDPLDPDAPKGPPPGVSKVQRILLSVLGGILAVLALVALFFVGARLPDLLGPAPAIANPSASPSPSASGLPLGPVEPGEYAWDELLGRECLDPFVDPWQPTFVVVDCAAPHPAQMVRRGEFGPTAFETGPTVYPGEEAVQARAIVACRAGGIFDPAAVIAVTDAAVQASYPTEEAWNDGNRDYFCFVSRTSGEPITGDLTLAPVAPVEPAAP